MPPERTNTKDAGRQKRRGRASPSIYDATGDRVAAGTWRWRFHPVQSRVKKLHLDQDAISPEEALFQSEDAPERYEEDDIYAADRALPKDLPLPDSDLLKAIHTYTADFYARQFPKNAYFMERSMDETALLALGYLLEEAACQDLGETGDLALVEGRLQDDDLHLSRQAQAGFTHEDLPSVKDPPSQMIHTIDYKRRELGALRLQHPK